MARRTALSPTTQRSGWLLWCLVSLGVCSGALLVISGVAVRTELGKLGAANSYEFQVRVLGQTAYRTTIVDARQGPPTWLYQVQSLSLRWGAALAVVFAVIGGSVGAAVALLIRSLTWHWSLNSHEQAGGLTKRCS